MAAAKAHLDFLSIMTYDYHGSGWEPSATNFLAPWADALVSLLVLAWVGVCAGAAAPGGWQEGANFLAPWADALVSVRTCVWW